MAAVNAVATEAAVEVHADLNADLLAVPAPAYEVRYNGRAITADISPYVLGVEVTDNLNEADELEIEVEDVDGRWIDAWYPDKGATLEVAIGYRGETLVPQGKFQIDSIELSGPPDTVHLHALSASVSDAIRTRTPRTFEKTTLAEIAQRIAKLSGLTLMGAIEPLPIDHLTQFGETDLAFLRRVALSYGYALKVLSSEKKLVLWHIESLCMQEPVRVVDRSDLERWHFSDSFEDAPQQVRNRKHDRKSGKLIAYTVNNEGTVVVAGGSPQDATNQNTLELSRAASTPATSQAAARAAMVQKQLERTTGDITFWGDAALAAGQSLTLTGFGRFNGKYTTPKVHHSLRRDGGFITDMELKRVIPAEEGRGGQAKAGKSPPKLDVYGVVGDDQVAVVGQSSRPGRGRS